MLTCRSARLCSAWPLLAAAALLLFGLAFTPQAAAEEAEPQASRATAIFAGGCFWCMEPPFDALPGVLETTAGYTGGETKDPSYDQVKQGRTGHYEALRVTYDPRKVSYEKLLDVFWHNIDPFNPRGQFCDRGSQYRAAIFVADEAQRQAAEKSLQAVNSRTKLEIVTEILPTTPFYKAEEYHQDYYKKNPLQYRYYRYSCGRDQRLREIWGAAAGH